MSDLRYFRVENSKKKRFLVIEHGNEYWSCSCPNWNIAKKIDCSHILTVKLSILHRDEIIGRAITEMKNFGEVSKMTKKAYEAIGNKHTENKILIEGQVFNIHTEDQTTGRKLRF